MPKLTKKFLVFPDTDDIYVAEEWDYALVKQGVAIIFDRLEDAKKEALANLDRNYQERKEQIQSLKYKDFC